MATKTNAVRLVQQAGIPCREAFYEFDEQDLSGVHAAQAVGMPEEQVFKTLVARGEKTGINVFCIPVCCELDLKKAARAVGAKAVELLPVKEINAVTGYIRGGRTAIGMKKQYPTVIDQSAGEFDRIIISGGRIGSQIFLAPDDFIKATGGSYGDILAEM